MPELEHALSMPTCNSDRSGVRVPRESKRSTSLECSGCFSGFRVWFLACIEPGAKRFWVLGPLHLCESVFGDEQSTVRQDVLNHEQPKTSVSSCEPDNLFSVPRCTMSCSESFLHASASSLRVLVFTLCKQAVQQAFLRAKAAHSLIIRCSRKSQPPPPPLPHHLQRVKEQHLGKQGSVWCQATLA